MQDYGNIFFLESVQQFQLKYLVILYDFLQKKSSMDEKFDSLRKYILWNGIAIGCGFTQK